MFDFEKLNVYKKAEETYTLILEHILKKRFINFKLKDQLGRSSSSIVLNIAEGSGKFSKRDKRNFYLIARGSTSESVSTLKLLNLEKTINTAVFDKIYVNLDEIGKMLTGLIKKME